MNYRTKEIDNVWNLFDDLLFDQEIKNILNFDDMWGFGIEDQVKNHFKNYAGIYREYYERTEHSR
jgi:hypothetical protein